MVLAWELINGSIKQQPRHCFVCHWSLQHVVTLHRGNVLSTDHYNMWSLYTEVLYCSLIITICGHFTQRYCTVHWSLTQRYCTVHWSLQYVVTLHRGTVHHLAKRPAGALPRRLCWSAGHLPTETSAWNIRRYVGKPGHNLSTCFRYVISCLSLSVSRRVSSNVWELTD